MKRQRTYTVIKTYIGKQGNLATGQTGIIGGTEKEAMQIFNTTVIAAGTTHKNIVGVVLVDAAENVMAEWTHQPEMERAA